MIQSKKSLLAAKQASIDERHDVIINIFCLAAFFPDVLLVTSSWLEMISVGFRFRKRCHLIPPPYNGELLAACTQLVPQTFLVAMFAARVSQSILQLHSNSFLVYFWQIYVGRIALQVFLLIKYFAIARVIIGPFHVENFSI